MSTNNFKPTHGTWTNNPTATFAQSGHSADDADVIGKDTWEPSKEIFQSFLKRDQQLAKYNLLLAMSDGKPMSLRDMKDCMLHAIDTIERVVAAHVKAGKLKEDKGFYTLA